MCIYIYVYILVGGVNHLEIYESQWDGLYILWKINNVPNHQPACIYIMVEYILIR